MESKSLLYPIVDYGFLLLPTKVTVSSFITHLSACLDFLFIYFLNFFTIASEKLLLGTSGVRIDYEKKYADPNMLTW